MMGPVGLLDTGPLVSSLATGLEHRATEEWKRLRPPLLTCEPVLTEAAFLLKREGRDIEIGRCHWQTPAWSGSLKSTRPPRCSRWTATSEFIAATATR